MISPKDFIASRLRGSIQQCQLRGLHSAATWAAEQLMGLEDDQVIGAGLDQQDSNVDSFVELGLSDEKVGTKEVGAILLGSSLMATGQYQRCAHNLRSEGSRKIQSNLGIFLYAYAQYLAGEKVRMQAKEEKEKKEKGKTQCKTRKNDNCDKVDEGSINPYVQQLHGYLQSVHKNGQMDSYLLYIFAVVTRDLHKQVGKSVAAAMSNESDGTLNDPLSLFKASLAHSPWNWSCWLELSNYCLINKLKVPTWDEICAEAPTKNTTPIEKQCGRAMFAFFMAHMYLERHRGDLALQAMEKLHKIFPSSVHLYTHVGVAYYSQRLYDQAESCFEVVRNKDPFRLQHVDTYSNILYVKEKSAELSYLAHSIVEIEKYAPEVCCVVGNYYSLKGQHERALMYFQRALRLDFSYLSAWTLMGHEYMELRNTAAAVQCYRSALNVSELDYRAWYGLGQTYEMLHLYQYAHYYFKKAAFLRPSDARMWSAVGNCLLKLGMKSEAIATYERAVNSGDREGIATRDLARLCRDENQNKRAAELFYKYLQCNLFEEITGNEDGLPTTLEGLAKVLNEDATEDRLNFQDSKCGGIDNVSDSEQAEAILYLATYFKTSKEYNIAEFFCARLLSFHGPEGDAAKLMLKELRTMHREPSFSMQSHSKPKHEHPNEMVGSPLFSPFSNMSNIDDSHIMNTSARLSSIRNPRRESMGSALDPFDSCFSRCLAMLEYLCSTATVPSVEGILDVSRLLKDFEWLLAKGEDDAFESNEEYMKFMELYFLLKNLRELSEINLYQAYYKPNSNNNPTPLNDTNSASFPLNFDRVRYEEQLTVLDRALADIRTMIENRINTTDMKNLPLPRIVQLCKEYGFSKQESDLFQLMVVIQGSNNSHVLNSMSEEDFLRKMTAFQRISGISEVDIDMFCDGERSHMKENIVTVDEENGTQFNLRVQKVAVQLLYGRKVKADDLLKISQTSLENIIVAEQIMLNPNHPQVAEARAVINSKKRSAEEAMDEGDEEEEDDEEEVDLDEEIEGEEDEVDDACGDGEDDIVVDDANPLSRQASYESTSSNHNTTSSNNNKKVISLKHPIKLARTNSWSSHGPGSTPRAKLHSSPKLQGTHTSNGNGSVPNSGSKKLPFVGDDQDEEMLIDSNGSPQHIKSHIPGAIDGSLAIKSSKKATATATTGATTAMATATSKSNDLLASSTLSESDSGFKPYDTHNNQLEYLEDSFQLIALMIKGNVARMKDDLKKEGTSRYNHSWGDGAGDLKHSQRELMAKLKLQENRIQRRIEKTIETGLPSPRLETLMTRFQLDSFEKRLILLLIGKTVAPIVKTLLDTLDTGHARMADDSITVGQALSILCHDFNLQISHRKYFYQSSKLMKNAVISLSRPRWHSGSGDLTENRIMLDRRILDWAVGLDSEINELVEGSDLYEPKVQLSQIVLPSGYIERILSQCSAYDAFQEYRLQVGLENQLVYGNSLVILLWGKSGTGKTMTVNAVANKLGKKVLMVDFNSLLNKKDGEAEVDLKGLFRESKMNNAVLFFDECETIFRSRNHGSDRMLNSLLTEIERHEGIVFMATNRPYEIDEAMHRRITMVLEYREPDSVMRKMIWDNLLGITSGCCTMMSSSSASDTSSKSSASESSSVPVTTSAIEMDSNANATKEKEVKTPKKGLVLDSSVDTAVLSSKFHLTGGFIKNAVLSAMLSALSRDRLNPIIAQKDLIEGCKMQMRGNLSQRAFLDKLPAKRCLKDLFVSESDRNILRKIIRYEETRAKVYGSWNFSVASSSSSAAVASRCEQRACINLLAGNRGSGKATVVETIAYELGEKRMKWLHVADFANQTLLDVTDVFKALVKDSSIMDAIIVIDGFEHVLDDPSAGPGSDSKVHLLLSRIMDILYEFEGCVFLIAHIEHPQNITLQRDFGSRLYSFMRFVMPPADIRTSVWKSLIPPAAPIATDVDFNTLGRKFELFPGSIQAAISHAAAEAASRPAASQKIGFKDLLSAGEYEIAKSKSGNHDMISKLFS